MADDDNVSDRFLKRIESEKIKRNLNDSGLAGFVKLSNATISNMFKYKIASRRTIAALCEKLRINEAGEDAIKLDIYGYHDKKKYDHYVGNYLWIRPIFDHDDYIGCYPLEIAWDDEISAFKAERNTKDGRLSAGTIYINDRGYLNIFSAEGGYASLTTVSSLTESGLMFGAMLCLGEVAGNMVAPTCAPVVLIRKHSIEGHAERLVGPTDSDYGHFRELLSKAVTSKYAFFKTHMTSPA